MLQGYPSSLALDPDKFGHRITCTGAFTRQGALGAAKEHATPHARIEQGD
jgi:hypothetical protein